MIAKIWPYGTKRRAAVVIARWSPPGKPEGISDGQLLTDQEGEGHLCVGEAADWTAQNGDLGTLTFTQGGPTGGYWKFTKDVT